MRLTVSCSLLLIVVLFSGCRTIWVHQDWDPGKYRSDRADCRGSADWRTCMFDRGWQAGQGFAWEPRSHRAP